MENNDIATEEARREGFQIGKKAYWERKRARDALEAANSKNDIMPMDWQYTDQEEVDYSPRDKRKRYPSIDDYEVKRTRQDLDEVISSSIQQEDDMLDLEDMGLLVSDTEKVAQILKNNKSFDTLNISFNDIKSNGLIYLSEIFTGENNINSLDIGHASISDEGVIHLCETLRESNHNLVTVDLGSNNVTGEGAAKLIDSGLEEVMLRGNPIGDKGAEQIAKALEKSKKLELMDLRYTGITDKGAEKLANAVEKNANIKYLELGENNISDELYDRISRALANNRMRERYSNKPEEIQPRESYTQEALTRSSSAMEL